MFRLASLMYSFLGATLAGIGVIIVLVIGLDTLSYILIAAAAGAIIAMPASWMLAKAIKGME